MGFAMGKLLTKGMQTRPVTAPSLYSATGQTELPEWRVVITTRLLTAYSSTVCLTSGVSAQPSQAAHLVSGNREQATWCHHFVENSVNSLLTNRLFRRHLGCGVSHGKISWNLKQRYAGKLFNNPLITKKIFLFNNQNRKNWLWLKIS